MMLEAEAFILNEEYAEISLSLPPEIALDLRHLAPEGLLSVVATGSRKDTVPRAVPVSRA